MRNHLSCRAMGMNCSFEVHDESEKEITAVIRGHLERVHRIELTNALSQKARDLILLDMASNRK
jgi:predicted small metal-binding protein